MLSVGVSGDPSEDPSVPLELIRLYVRNTELAEANRRKNDLTLPMRNQLAVHTEDGILVEAHNDKQARTRQVPRHTYLTTLFSRENAPTQLPGDEFGDRAIDSGSHSSLGDLPLRHHTLGNRVEMSLMKIAPNHTMTPQVVGQVDATFRRLAPCIRGGKLDGELAF